MDPLEAIVQKTVTQWLDPPLGQKIETKNLKNALDQLIQACDESCTDSDFCPYDSSWLIARCDLYRCLIAVSLLLVVKNDVTKTEALKKIVEQSLLLLQILVGAESQLELSYRTPPSQYQILNDLLIEPLVPLSREERQQFWSSNSNQVDEEEMEGATLTLPSKKELIKEERQLIKMASKPIPNDNNEKSPLEEEDSKTQLFLPGDILCKDQRLLLLRCGALIDQNGNTAWLTEKSSISKCREGDSSKVIVTINKGQHFEIEEGRKWIQPFDIAQKQVQSRHELRKRAEEMW